MEGTADGEAIAFGITLSSVQMSSALNPVPTPDT